VVLDRINTQMEVDNFHLNSEFVVNFFVMFCELSKVNDMGRTLLRTKVIVDSTQHNHLVTPIEFAVNALSRILKTLNGNSLALVKVILDLLLLSLVGPCQENQDEIMKTEYVSCVNELMTDLSDEMDISCRQLNRHKKEIKIIQTSALKVLRFLIEGNRNYSAVVSRIKEIIKADQVMTSICESVQEYQKSSDIKVEAGKDAEFLDLAYISNEILDDQLGGIFDQFFVLKTILQEQNSLQMFLTSLDPLQCSYYNFFDQHSASTEILFQNKIHKVNFTIQPVFRHLGVSDKEKIMTEVRLDTPKNKIYDFLQHLPLTYDYIFYKASKAKNPFIFSQTFYSYLKKLGFFVLLLINLWMMIFFNQVPINQMPVTDPDYGAESVPMRILTWTHLFLTILRFLIFFSVDISLELMRNWRIIYDQLFKELKALNGPEYDELKNLAVKKYVELTFLERSNLFQLHNKLNKKAVINPTVAYIFQSIRFISSFNKQTSITLYTTLTILAFFQNIHFFYCILLLDIIVTSLHAGNRAQPSKDHQHLDKTLETARPRWHLRYALLTQSPADILLLRVRGLRVLPRRLLHVGHLHRAPQGERLHGAQAVLLHPPFIRTRV
jgi:hypothetical protein